MPDSVLYQVTDGVGEIRLNRPDAMNTYNETLVAQLSATLDTVAEDPCVRAVLLTGNGRAFCAGADLKMMLGALKAADSEDSGAFIETLHQTLLKLHRLPVPVICAVNGACAGGGIGLALAADITWAAESASFTAGFSAIALTPDTGTSYLLPRAVGERVARDLLLTSRRVPAQEALLLGLVSRVLSDDELIAEATQLATRLAAGPTTVLTKTRELVDAGVRRDLAAQLYAERAEVTRRLLTADLAEGVTAFVEKRRPRFGPRAG